MLAQRIAWHGHYRVLLTSSVKWPAIKLACGVALQQMKVGCMLTDYWRYAILSLRYSSSKAKNVIIF